MATATKQREGSPQQKVQKRQDVAVFQQPRLPYHQAIEERYGVDRGSWKALVEAVYPTARSVDSVVMALAYCKARNLDPFKRPVHIVPMWSSVKREYVETVWPGISEVRTTAFRTKNYAGMDEAIFGSNKTKTFKGVIRKRNEPERPIEAKVTFPEWCQITVYRDLNGKRNKFVGPKVYWMESYAKVGGTDVPNDMWKHRSVGQLEKCAEAAALRRAFPEELGNEYTAEEMEGQILHVSNEPSIGGTDFLKPPAPPTNGDALTPPVPPQGTSDEVYDGEVMPPEDETQELEPKNTKELLEWVDVKLSKVTIDMLEEYPDVLGEIWENEIEPKLAGKFPPDVDAAQAIYRKHEKRLGGQ